MPSSADRAETLGAASAALFFRENHHGITTAMRIPAGAQNLLRRLSGALVSRAAWMIPRRWFWLAFLAGAVAMSCAPHMARANGTPGTLSATSITGATRFSSGLSGTLNAVLIETERRSYHQAPVSIPWSRFGGAAKAGMRGVLRFSPYVGMALTAAEIAGWARDGDWFNKNDGNPGSQVPDAAVYICVDRAFVSLPADYCVEATPAGAQRLASFLMDKPSAEFSGATVKQAYPENCPTECNVRVRIMDQYETTKRFTAMARVPKEWKPHNSRNTDYKPATEVSEAEMAEAIAANSSNFHNMLHDSTGAPHQFPEVQNALNQMALGISAANGSPAPNVNGQEVNPENTNPAEPAPSTGGQGSELPAFCEWARVVCEFITWYKDEGEPLDKPEVPFEEETFEMQDWSSGQSGGSCPAPETVNVMGESIDFSYQPICDLADLLYGINIAGALVIAGFIIAGLRK